MKGCNQCRFSKTVNIINLTTFASGGGVVKCSLRNDETCGTYDYLTEDNRVSYERSTMAKTKFTTFPCDLFSEKYIAPVVEIVERKDT